MNDRIAVEVVFALPREQRCIALQLPAGSTLREAIRRSGLLEDFGLSLEELQSGQVGIFGRKQAFDTRLADGDRVEIYRRLRMSPTEARRLRAQTRAENGDR